MSEQPSILKTGLDLVKTRMADIPEGKNGALIMVVDWHNGLPTARFGVATKVNDSLQLGAEAESRFSKSSTNAKVYAALTW